MGQLKEYAGLTVVSGPDWPGVTYFCSTRLGGVSKGPWASLNMGFHTGDDPARVALNRQRILRENGSATWLNQVHGTAVYDADHDRSARAGPVEQDGAPHDAVQADALVSASPGRVLAIMTADCLPVVMGSTDGKVIGIAHAGWRGLAAGVLENTLEALQAKHPDSSAQWRAWLGPAISAACFEVGDDVRDAFIDVDRALYRWFVPTGAQGKWLADLSGIARHRLFRCGVMRVDGGNLCTMGRPDLFYSYRRDGVTGRMATFAWLET